MELPDFQISFAFELCFSFLLLMFFSLDLLDFYNFLFVVTQSTRVMTDAGLRPWPGPVPNGVLDPHTFPRPLHAAASPLVITPWST